MRNAIVLLPLGLALMVSAAGQQGAGNTSGGTDTGGKPPSGQPDPNTDQGRQEPGISNRDPYGQRQTQPAPQRRPIYLSGKVVMDTGEPPPEPVVIERICHGRRHPEGYSDSKGGFHFEVGGSPTAAISDASVGGTGPMAGGGRFGAGVGGPFGSSVGYSTGAADLSGCEIRASLPGFQSDSISLGRRRPLDNPDIGVIVLHGLSGVKRSSVISVTTLEAPDKARASYEKALRELGKKQGKREKAIKQLEKAVALYPRFAAAWSVLGSERMKTGDMQGATEALERAIEVDPGYLRPYPDLVQIQLRNQDWDRTAELAETMLSLHPGRTQASFFKAVADFSRGDHAAAEAASRAIQRQDDAEQFPQTHQMIGMIAAQRGDFQDAAREYRRYLELSPEASSAEAIRKQLEHWEALGVIQPVSAPQRVEKR